MIPEFLKPCILPSFAAISADFKRELDGQDLSTFISIRYHPDPPKSLYYSFAKDLPDNEQLLLRIHRAIVDCASENGINVTMKSR